MNRSFLRDSRLLSLWLRSHRPSSFQTVLCAGCEEYRFLHDGLCLLDCPEGSFQDTELGECRPCHPDCSVCDGPNADDCDGCRDAAATLDNGACLGACPAHSYRDSATGECRGRLSMDTQKQRGRLQVMWTTQTLTSDLTHSACSDSGRMFSNDLANRVLLNCKEIRERLHFKHK